MLRSLPFLCMYLITLIFQRVREKDKEIPVAFYMLKQLFLLKNTSFRSLKSSRNDNCVAKTGGYITDTLQCNKEI